MGRTASTEPQCLYNGAPLPLPMPLLPLWAVRSVQSLSVCTKVHLYLYLYLYSLYLPYGQYRASVPVQVCTLLILLLKALYSISLMRMKWGVS